MRAGAAVVAMLLVAGLGAPGLSAEARAASDPTGASVDDRGPDGLAVWAALLDAADYSVERVDRAPADAELDPRATTVLIDPGSLGPSDVGALRDLVEQGGHVIVGGELDAASATRLAGSTIEFESPGATTATPLVAAPEVERIAQVSAAGGDSIAHAGATLPILGGEGEGALAALATRGAGRLVILADASPLTNERIESADNAQFALNLAGPPERPIEFLERVQEEPGEGLGALPGEWLWVLGGLLLAGLCLIAARARRLGPPQLAHRVLPPPRRAYVDAMAAQLARVGDRDAATRELARLQSSDRPEVHE